MTPEASNLGYAQAPPELDENTAMPRGMAAQILEDMASTGGSAPEATPYEIGRALSRATVNCKGDLSEVKSEIERGLRYSFEMLGDNEKAEAGQLARNQIRHALDGFAKNTDEIDDDRAIPREMAAEIASEVASKAQVGMAPESNPYAIGRAIGRIAVNCKGSADEILSEIERGLQFSFDAVAG